MSEKADATRREALIVKHWAKAPESIPTPFRDTSLRAGFVTSALADGADLFKVMDVTEAQRRKIQVQIRFSPVNSMSIRYNQRVSAERAAHMDFWL